MKKRGLFSSWFWRPRSQDLTSSGFTAMPVVGAGRSRPGSEALDHMTSGFLLVRNLSLHLCLPHFWVWPTSVPVPAHRSELGFGLAFCLFFHWWQWLGRMSGTWTSVALPTRLLFAGDHLDILPDRGTPWTISTGAATLAGLWLTQAGPQHSPIQPGLRLPTVREATISLFLCTGETENKKEWGESREYLELVLKMQNFCLLSSRRSRDFYASVSPREVP